jgi:hypothetical protein
MQTHSGSYMVHLDEKISRKNHALQLHGHALHMYRIKSIAINGFKDMLQ